ncbi:MAG: DNA cytosine methyltransferase [Saprospiraceae bacterium]|nr:DNA cytosine methyltransferase [Candidatus Brachybacter algidus]
MGIIGKKRPCIFSKGGEIPNNRPIIVELFCGCGGTSMGFEMAGFEVVLGCDIHTPSIQTFKANHPNCSTILGDVKKLTLTRLRNYLIVDL